MEPTPKKWELNFRGKFCRKYPLQLPNLAHNWNQQSINFWQLGTSLLCKFCHNWLLTIFPLFDHIFPLFDHYYISSEAALSDFFGYLSSWGEGNFSLPVCLEQNILPILIKIRILQIKCQSENEYELNNEYRILDYIQIIFKPPYQSIMLV